MTASQWQRVKGALASALDTGASRRPAVLRQRLEDDPDLHALGAEMLAANDRAPSDLMKTRVGADAPRPVAATAAPDTKQSQVWGDFVLVEELGRGGFGVVYRAIESPLRREVALKLIDPSVRTAHRDSIRLEGQHLARIDHPNVVKVYGIHRHGNRLAIAMEYVRGRTLADLVAIKGTFTERDAALTGAALCGALTAVHRGGLLHRDIKASNVMRTRNGRIVLMDFGAGRDLYREPGTDADLIGTPVYMAPEVLSGGHASTASDVYSLGVLLYFLLTGRYPQGPTAVIDAGADARHARTAASLHGVRAELADLVARMLEPEPARRPLMDPALKSALTRAVPRPPRVAKQDVSSAEGTNAEQPLASSEGLGTPVVPHPSLRSFWFDHWTWRNYALAAPAALLMLFLQGLLTTWEYNQVLGRHDSFRVEGLHLYLAYGAMTWPAILVRVVLAAVACASLSLTWRLACAVFPSRTGLLRERLQRMTLTLQELRLLTRGTAEQAFCLAAFIALVGVFYLYQDVLTALTTSADTGPGDVFGVLRRDARATTANFRSLMLVLLLALACAPVVLRELPPGGESRAATFARAGLMLLIMVVLTACWRVMFGPPHVAVMYEKTRCFVIGEHGVDWLLHCPSLEAPRNRVVRRDGKLLGTAGNNAVAFDGYPPVTGYPTDESASK